MMGIGMAVRPPRSRGPVLMMIDALRRIGGSLWMVDNAFSGAFVDNAGTTPVTAVGDLIGKVLDNTGTNHATQSAVASKPSVQRVPKRLGPNLVVNGTFDSGTTGWTPNGMTLSVVSGRLRVFSAAGSSTRPYAAFATTPGNQYLVIGEVFPQADAVSLNVGTTPGGNSIIAGTPSTATRTERYTFTATTATTYIFPTAVVTAGSFYELDNIEVREVLEWANVISFADNDFLQTGITTGEQGFVAAAVTFGAVPGAALQLLGTTANGGLDGAGILVTAGGASVLMSVGTGSAQHFATRTAPSVGVPAVVAGGWNGSSVFVATNGTETSSARSGTATSPGTLTIGARQVSPSAYLNGLLHAIVYTPVLPDAATRKIIINGLAALQGRTL